MCIEDKPDFSLEIKQLQTFIAGIKEIPVEPEEPIYEFLAKSDLNCLEQIERRFRNNYYHSLDRLLEDLESLVLNTMKRCLNILAKNYLTHFLTKAQEIIAPKKKEHLQKWNTYYNVKLANNQSSNCLVGGGDSKVWYKHFDESTKRQYFEINDYKIKVPGREDCEMTEK